MKTFVCKTIKLYNYLTEKGYKPYKVSRDIFNPDKYVWLYDDTAALRRDTDLYFEQLN